MSKRPPMPDEPRPADFPMPESVRRFAAGAPLGAAVVGQPEPAEPATEPPAQAGEHRMVDLAELRAMYPKREPTQQMSLKVPKSLYDEMVWISRITGTTMTEMLLAGAAKELAKIKARLPKGVGQ